MTRFPRLVPRLVPRVGARSAAFAAFAASAALSACVPPGNSTPSDAGAPSSREPSRDPSSAPIATPAFRPSANVMTSVFEDNFDRPNSVTVPPATDAAPLLSAESRFGDRVHVDARRSDGAAIPAPVPSSAASADASLPVGGPSLGPDWEQAGTTAWRIENGKLCAQNARNHGVWLTRVLPVNARIEFDAVSDVQDGDIKAELWGDGRSAATSISYTNATSYLTILGGWHNKFHVLARINEHGTDRKEIHVDPESDDPVQKPVTAGQVYRFKIERTDGKTVRWFVNGVEYLSYADAQPLAGVGHDHFGFNDWEAKVCFDNVKVTPL